MNFSFFDYVYKMHLLHSATMWGEGSTSVLLFGMETSGATLINKSRDSSKNYK